MLDPINEIIRFQTDRQLDKQKHDLLNEATSVVEEIFEDFGFDVPKEKRYALKIKFQSFLRQCEQEQIIIKTKHDKLDPDPNADQIIFNIGAILKKGYEPSLVLNEAAKEINSRKGRIVNGKFEKYLPEEPGYQTPYKADYTKCKRITHERKN